jgi:hypothetical protein
MPSPVQINRIYFTDAVFRELTNRGSVTALNEIFNSKKIQDASKTPAMQSVLNGAFQVAEIQAISIATGEQFLAVNATTNVPMACVWDPLNPPQNMIGFHE